MAPTWSESKDKGIDMPLEDRTGPCGEGPMTGRTDGPCPDDEGMASGDDAMLVISGDPEVLDFLLSRILEMADVADEAGEHEAADRLSSLLTEVKMMKAAQYEGFQNYWIANGRAFELAFKQSVEEDPESSFQEAWAKTLEDYMDSLLGDQSEFLKKHVKQAQYEGIQNHWVANSRAFELSFKEKVDSQPKDSKSFLDAWMATLDEYEPMLERDDFVEKALRTAAREDLFLASVLGSAARRKISLKHAYREWEANHKECLRQLMSRVAANLDKGFSPGVSFYEATDFFLSGRHAASVERRIAKEASRLGNWIGKQWHKLLGRDAMAQIKEIQNVGRKVDRLIDKWDAETSKRPVDPRVIQADLQPLLESVYEFYEKVGVNPRAGGQSASAPVALPPIPMLVAGNKANPKYVDPAQGGVAEQGWAAFKADMVRMLSGLEGAAKDFERYKGTHFRAPLQVEVSRQTTTQVQQALENASTEISEMIGMLTGAAVPADIPDASGIVSNVLQQAQTSPGGANPTLMANLIWRKATQGLQQAFSKIISSLRQNRQREAAQALGAFQNVRNEAVRNISQILSQQRQQQTAA